MLQAEHLRKEFLTPQGKTVVAVADASLQVADGEVLGILGPNGAGKTTLLRMLGTIVPPTSGRCWIDGVATDSAPDTIRRNIGFLSGNTRLYGRLTAEEVLRFFGRLYGMPEDGIGERIRLLAEHLDMAPFLGRRCETLSTGQTQKVSIARVLLHDPKVLILDEPTLGLDIMSSRSILAFIREARDRGHSVVFSTHYMTEAERLCDRIALIHEGRLLCTDTLAGICARTGADNLQDAFLALIEPATRGTA
jgi:sodium transport system ATP-binding protein